MTLILIIEWAEKKNARKFSLKQKKCNDEGCGTGPLKKCSQGAFISPFLQTGLDNLRASEPREADV